jgi:hypothetical protein
MTRHPELAVSTKMIHFCEDLIPGEFPAGPEHLVKQAAGVVSDNIHDALGHRMFPDVHGRPPCKMLFRPHTGE